MPFRKKPEKVTPPSPRQIDTLRFHLKTCLFIEFAATLSNIGHYEVLEWFRLAIAGDPDYLPVLDMYREETALLAKGVMTPIYEKAFKEGDSDMLKFIYNNRIKRFESRFLDKLERIEDDVEKRREGHGFAMTAEQIAEAEARQMSVKN